MRMLRDRGALLQRLADQARVRGHDRTEQKFRTKAREAEEQAASILDVLHVSTPSALSALDIGAADEEVA